MAPRRLIAALAALLLLPAVANAAQAPRERALYEDAPSGMYLLDRGWSTRADGESRFRRVSVPHSFNAKDLTARGMRSRVQWYRTRFALPSDRRAGGWRLRFESVHNAATVWLNGKRLGGHRGAHLPFELPAGSIRRGDNELLVRVDGRLGKNDLPPGDREQGWWNYGGILREVYLRRVHDFDLADLQVVADEGTPSKVDVGAMVRNTARRGRRLDYRMKVSGPGGFELDQPVRGPTVRAGGLARLNTSFEIPAPALWTPESPSLYRLELTLPGGQTTRTHFAVRHWGVTPDGHVTLNGRRTSLRGASFHESTPEHGAALTTRDLDEIVGQLKSLGADVARQHYPPHPRLLEAFDREGIAFWEQIPVWRLRDQHLRGALRRRALAELRQTVLRDRNHASVMTWSISNEILRSGRNDRAYVKAARSLLRRLDPTRLLGADKSLRPASDIPAAYAELDVLGVSEYIGWYGGDSSELPADLAALRAKLPGVGLLVTEFGAEANRSGPATEKGTVEFQARFLADHLDMFETSGLVDGAIVWSLRDFACRPGWSGGNPSPDPPWNEKGIFNRDGLAKPAMETVKERFDRVPSTS